MEPRRLLLIDDHAMFRAGLVALLRLSFDGVQVDEAASVAEALHADPPTPDLILLDIMLHGLNGLDGIDVIRRRWAAAPIIVVSSDNDPRSVQLALSRGASTFVSKERTADNLVEVIRQRLTQAASGTPGAHRSEARCDDDAPLTPRQLEVLDLLCQGLTNKAIGRRLDLSENTVRWHVHSILALLNVTNRSEAAFAARRQGIIR
jgi:DNA-binding NarL/FixJ family response regulator